MTKEEIKLRKEILKIVKEYNRELTTIRVIELIQPSIYSSSQISRMVWRLIDRGEIGIDINRELYLQQKGKEKMTTRSEAAKKAHDTRRRNAQKRSDAARKAWATRRAQAEFERRSQAAKKAWETRRGN